MSGLKEYYNSFHAYAILPFLAAVNFRRKFGFPHYYVWIVALLETFVLVPLYNKSNDRVKKVLFRCMQVVGNILFWLSILVR